MSDKIPDRNSYRGVIIELERCKECDTHLYCTRHVETKYVNYEAKLRTALEARVALHSFDFQTNPGPGAHGVRCLASKYNPFMYSTMVQNPNNRRWYPETSFRYPRIGGFEVDVCKVKKRVPVFSKLKSRKWPNPEWLAERIEEEVTGKLGGWGDAPVEKKIPKKYATKRISDEELRQLIKSKFATIVGAFRSFDTNGDGVVNYDEFVKGLQSAGVDLPVAQCKQLWKVADEDGTGVIEYQEFARKFASYKATHSLHRHVDRASTAQQENIQRLHGSAAVTVVQKHAAIRGEDELQWGVTEDQVDESLSEGRVSPHSIQHLARDPRLSTIPAEECTCDMIRAKILQKTGSMLTAFRHFDLSNDSRISFDEFSMALPRVLGEPVSREKINALWLEFDPNWSGDIDLDEFTSNNLIDPSAKAVMEFKGQAVDPRMILRQGSQSNEERIMKRKSTQSLSSQQDIADSTLATTLGLEKQASSAAHAPPAGVSIDDNGLTHADERGDLTENITAVTDAKELVERDEYDGFD